MSATGPPATATRSPNLPGSLERFRYPKSHDGVTIVGGIPFARRRAQRPRPEHPRSTAIYPHALLGAIGARVAYASFVGTAVCWRAGVALSVTILRPLPNVADNVVQTEGVRI